MVTIPVEYVYGVLIAISASGIVLGLLSAFSPVRSIELYQWIMRRFNWRVDPLDWRMELRNTRVLGALMTLVSVLILGVLYCPQFQLRFW